MPATLWFSYSKHWPLTNFAIHLSVQFGARNFTVSRNRYSSTRGLAAELLLRPWCGVCKIIPRALYGSSALLAVVIRHRHSRRYTGQDSRGDAAASSFKS